MIDANSTEPFTKREQMIVDFAAAYACNPNINDGELPEKIVTKAIALADKVIELA